MKTKKTKKEIVQEVFIRCALDILIEKKHLIQQQFDDGLMSYMDYSFLIEDVQNDIDSLCPIDNIL